MTWTCEVVDAGEDGTGNCAGGLADVPINELDLELYGAGTFLFGVMVRKFTEDGGNSFWRNDTESVLITVSYSIVPTIGIAALTVSKAKDVAQAHPRGHGRDARQPVPVRLQLVARGGLAARHDRGEASSTALTGTIDAATVGTTFLVLPAGSLTAGGVYQFMLTAEFDRFAVGDVAADPGTSALTVLVNAPPTSTSTLSVEPASGVVLQTAFSFACQSWVDDEIDLPLLYSFFFEIYKGDGTEYQLVAKTPTTSYSGALLPQGGGNSSIIGIGYVYDQLDAAARATDTIVCAPAQMSVSDLANLTATLIAESFESRKRSSRRSSRRRSGIVEHPQRPTARCRADYSRATCPVQQTCGDRLDGFVGLPGPINDPCWMPDATCDNDLLDGDETSVDAAAGCAPCRRSARRARRTPTATTGCASSPRSSPSPPTTSTTSRPRRRRSSSSCAARPLEGVLEQLHAPRRVRARRRDGRVRARRRVHARRVVVQRGLRVPRRVVRRRLRGRPARVGRDHRAAQRHARLASPTRPACRT